MHFKTLGFLFLFVCSNLFAQSKHELKLLNDYKNSNDSSQRVLILIALSDESFLRDRNISLNFAEHAYNLSKSLSIKELKIKALICLTNVTFETSNNSKAIELSNQLLKMVEEEGLIKYYAETYRIVGKNFHLRGDYPQALQYYYKGLKFSEQLKDTLLAGEFFNLLGGIYYNQNDYKNAFLYYNKGLQIQIKKNNKQKIGRGYLNIGSTYLILKNYTMARTTLDSAMVNYKRAQYQEGEMMVYTTIPEVFMATKQVDSAIKYLTIAYDFLNKNKRTFYVPQIDLQLARIYFDQNNLKEALIRSEMGIKMGRVNRQNHDLAGLYLINSQIHEKLGNEQEALRSFKLHKTYADSVINANAIKQQAEEAMKYDFAKKEFEQNLVTTQKELKQKQYVIIAIILVLITFIIFYYRYQLKQKANQLLVRNNKVLAEKNALIEEKSRELQASLNERELLLKEIHHRVKNNLQVISGLLELQKEELAEDGSKAAFDEGQSRIRSISLIHQNLYQNEKLGSIKFKNFVTELVDQIKEVFEQADKEVDVFITMPDNIIDIDTAVPLGLILNELLTNSYKYASSKDKQASIYVEMLDKGNGEFELNYRDNGPGLKSGIDFDNASTLGLRLIKGLSAQLAGTASYLFNEGSVFKIKFKDSKARMMA